MVVRPPTVRDPPAGASQCDRDPGSPRPRRRNAKKAHGECAMRHVGGGRNECRVSSASAPARPPRRAPRPRVILDRVIGASSRNMQGRRRRRKHRCRIAAAAKSDTKNDPQALRTSGSASRAHIARGADLPLDVMHALLLALSHELRTCAPPPASSSPPACGGVFGGARRESQLSQSFPDRNHRRRSPAGPASCIFDLRVPRAPAVPSTGVM